MSINAVEQALWQIANHAAEAEAYKADSAAYLRQFRLDPDEVDLIQALDFKSLADRGANVMLLIGIARAVVGPDCIPEYMGKMNS